VVVLAHLGHGYVQLLFVAPLLALLALGVADDWRRERRNRPRRPPDGDRS
jgi:hypothetical protein